jgi:hypothetical protein
MHTVSEALTTLNGMTAPAAFVSACGLLLLGIYNKYSKIVESLRSLHRELRGRKATDSASGLDHNHREQQIRSECHLLQRRLHNVLAQILAVAAAMVLFLLASLSIGAALLLGVPGTSAAVVLVIVGVVSLIVAMALAASEARFIWQIVSTELDVPSHSLGHADRSAVDGFAHAEGRTA